MQIDDVSKVINIKTFGVDNLFFAFFLLIKSIYKNPNEIRKTLQIIRFKGPKAIKTFLNLKMKFVCLRSLANFFKENNLREKNLIGTHE
jgi:hypothetical protein